MAPLKTTVITFEPRGNNAMIFERHDDELIVDGPAGTGKTMACLNLEHLRASKYAGSRHLFVRKTHTSLTASALVTFDQKVLHPLDGVKFFGGNAHEPAQYKYPNRSVIVVGGMDKPGKILSSEYDTCYVNQAEELTLDDWESITHRLRNNVMPYQQLLGDCNPGPPRHWLKLRFESGRAAMLQTTHRNNPEYYDGRGQLTEKGDRYINGKLEKLTGVRRSRYYLGLWVAAEGVVYEGWSPAIHLHDARSALAMGLPLAYKFDVTDRGYEDVSWEIPREWPRYWVLDFGFTNAFVWQAWAVDPDGRAYMYREHYMTQRLVEDHAKTVMQAIGCKRLTEKDSAESWEWDWTNAEPRPAKVICDHDAEGRATWSRKTGLGTTPANKAVKDGIQATQARMKPAGDGKPRLFIMRDVRIELDEELADSVKPAATADEIESYVWDQSPDKPPKEEPVKKDDHGMDAMRYLVADLDLPGTHGNIGAAAVSEVITRPAPIDPHKFADRPAADAEARRAAYYGLRSGAQERKP